MLAVMVDPCYWISRTGAGLVMSDTLPLSFQATGPFLHIGIVGGMTLLAWPLASVIYRTHSTGNPPQGLHLSLQLAALFPALHREALAAE